MELQEFVTESLNQIVKGVLSAQNTNKPYLVRINPKLPNFVDGRSKEVLVTPEGQAVVMVHFDVAVTITEGTGTKGGIGVFVGAIGLGAQGQSDKSSTSATSLQFQVPIAIPAT